MEVGRLGLHAPPRRVERKAGEEGNAAAVASHGTEEDLAYATRPSVGEIGSVDERDPVEMEPTQRAQIFLPPLGRVDLGSQEREHDLILGRGAEF
jgi:hypothetical protein